MDFQLREINCQKANTGDNFPQGVQDYNFSVGGASLWLPKKSYFKATMRITYNGAQAVNQEQVAFADNVIGNLFDNIYFRGGGQDISSIVSYAPQASILRQRLTKSGAWLNSMGKDVFALDSNFNSRVNKVTVDTDPEEEVERINLGASNHRLDYTLAFADTGVLTGVNTNFNGTGNPDVTVNAANGQPAVPLLRFGDYIDVPTINGITRVQVTGVTGATTATYEPVLATLSAVAATAGLFAYRGKGKKTTYTALWKPPIGIFDSDKALGSGDFRISLNPNARYKTAAIESVANLVPGAGSVNFEILELKLYIALIQDTVQQSGVESLFFSEQHLQSKPMTGLANSLDFTVPPSTKMIAFFLQSNKAGSDTRIPPSKFRALGNYELGVKSFQLTYANRSRPSTKWESGFDTTRNTMQQRFWDTYQECGLAELQGGTETMQEWMDRGPIYVYRFDRDSNDKSTLVQLQLEVDRYEPNCNVMLCAFYTRTVEIAYQNGMITDVKSLNV